MAVSGSDFGASYDFLSSSDPSIADDHSTMVKEEFRKSGMERSSATYSPHEESAFNQEVVSTVLDRSMKKHTDSLMQFLEEISSRMSQLESYCYNLDKSVEDMRSDLGRDHGESEARLKSLEKHTQEVRRSVQILRDKQELVDTQKELAKLELSKKESVSTLSSQKYEEKISPPLSEPKISDTPSEERDQQQLALALPNQVIPSVSSHSAPRQTHPYYIPPPQTPNALPPSHSYQPTQPQIQDPSGTGLYQTQPQVNHNAQAQSLTPYQHQQPWAQIQQPLMQPQSRPPTQPVNYSYPPSQPMQRPFPSTQAASDEDAMSYGPPPQHYKMGYGDGYKPVGFRPASPPADNPYAMHDPHRQQHLQQSSYPSSANNMVVPPQSKPRGHPYSELIEKLVGMGYRAGVVIGVIAGMEKYGEPIDFNAVLDKLNGDPTDVNAVLDQLNGQR